MKLKEIRALKDKSEIVQGYNSASTLRERFLFRVVHGNVLNPKLLGKQISELEDEVKKANKIVILMGGDLHEAKTSLASIKTNCGTIIHSGGLSDNQIEILNDIKKTTATLAESTMDGVLFAKLINGQGKIEPIKFTPAQITKMVQGIIGRYKSAFNHEVSSVIRLNSMRESYSIMGGEFVSKIVDNITSNAFKYTDNLVAVRVEDKGDKLKFTVEDNGHGIPEKDKESIFDPSKGSKRRDRDGSTHFGLPYSAATADEFSWKLDFESEVGKGTTFSLEIPLSTKPAEQPQ